MPSESPELALDPRWNAISDFDHRWAATSSASHAWIPFLFLEYDADASDPPIPLDFAALDPSVGETGSRGCHELAAVREFAGTLLGNAFDAEWADRLELCLGALPGYGRTLHVAVMLGRSVQSLAPFCLIAEAQAAAYLAGIGVKDAAGRVERLLALLPDRPAYCQFDFVLGSPVAPSVGPGCRPEHPAGWCQLLSRLGAERLCDPGKPLRSCAGREAARVGACPSFVR